MLMGLIYSLFRRLLGLVARDRLIRQLLAENMVLRHRLEVETRNTVRPRLRRRDRLFFEALSRLLCRDRWESFGFAPQTLLRWHRELVARKWTYQSKKAGRPPIDPKRAALIISMARNSSDWGCYRVKGELQGLGIRVGVTTIRRILRRAGVPPAPRRRGPTWSEFLRAQADGIVACDFFTVETVSLRTLYVLAFIKVGSRRLRFSVSTTHPDGPYATQQARDLAMDGHLEDIDFLIRDRDSKFIRSFDEVLATEGVRVIKTPIRAPNANAHAERVIRTIREEVTDRVLVLGPRHLNRLLAGFQVHYNEHRPHRGIGLASPATIGRDPQPRNVADIRRRRVLGGLISEYYEKAA